MSSIIKFIITLGVLGFIVANLAPMLNDAVKHTATELVSTNELTSNITKAIKDPSLKNAKEISQLIYGDDDPIRDFR